MSPVETQPNVIEQADFTAGVFLDVEESGIPKNGLSESLNNLIDVATGSIRSRKGFSRFFDNTANEGYRIYSLHPYTSPGGTRYLVAVLSTNIDSGSDNVMVYSLKLSTSTWTKISPSRNWNNPNGRHWGGTQDGTFYGGGEEDEMYSWRPGETDTGAWSAATNYVVGDQATVSSIEYRCVRAHINFTPATAANRPKYWERCFRLTPGVPVFWTGYTSTERPVDYAYTKEQAIKFAYTVDGDAFTDSFVFHFDHPKKGSHGIRFPIWQDDREYSRGDMVSRRTTTVATDHRQDVWKTWKCIKRHGSDTAGVDDHQPPDAAYWSKEVVPKPMDDSGRLRTKYWTKVPSCPKTRVALFHGNRLFARNDPTHSQVLVYSAQSKVNEREVGFGVNMDNNDADRIGEPGDPQWDPADWRTRGAPGGGFQPFETAEGDAIEALGSLGYYLVVFKRYSTWVIAGFNPESWTVRQLAPVGAIYAAAVCEHEGLLYFISDAGFFQTDGTQVVPVPGAEKIEMWLRKHVDWAGQPNDITMFSHEGFVWISIPADGQIAEESGASEKDPTLVICYDAVTQSFWPQSISMQAVAKQVKGGSAKLFFSGPNFTATDLISKTYDWGTWSAGAWATDNSGTRDEKRKRKSRRSVSGGAPIVYNLFENPSFESDTKWGAPSEWVKTTADGGAGSFNYGLVVNSTKAASRRGRRAAHVSNRRAIGWAGGYFNGAEGLKQTVTIGSVAACVMQVDYRRANWKDDPERVPNMKFLKNQTAFAPTGSKSLGNGWFRFYYNFTSVATALDYGFVVPEASDAHLDCAILTFNAGGPVTYFDGAGGEGSKWAGVTGGNRPLIMQYGTGYTDDEGVYESGSTVRTRLINTVLRTGWFSFGVLKEERRIRRTWALVRGNTASAFIRTFINYRQRGDVSNIVTVPDDVRASVHVENYVPDDAYSAQVHVEIEADRETAILGVALDTEPRRIRYWS